MISWPFNRNLLTVFVFITLTSHFFAQGDDCATSLQLNNVSNFCSGAAFYTNAGSTTGSWGKATCFGATTTEDVWFQFTAIGTDALISVGGIGNGGTMSNPSVAIYNGDCTTGVNEQGCASATFGSGIVQLYEGAMIQGDIYYIRVSTTALNEGSFELCVNNYTPSANPGADCGGAAFLCSQNPVSVGTLSGGGLDNDEPESNSCLENTFGADEGNSSWFYWTCGTSGTFTLDITPLNPTDDIDFIIYQLNSANPCGPRTILRCNSSSCLNTNGSTGLSLTDFDITEDPNCDPGENAYCQFINMTAGTSYAILINNFSANMGFTVNFGGTATFQGPNPNIVAVPISICTGGSVVFNGSTSTNVAGGLNWNFSNGGSQASAIGAGPHTISYSNPGTYTAILNGTDFAGCTSTETVTITVSPIPNAPQVSAVTYCQGATANALTATGSNLLWYPTATGGVGSSTAPIPSTATSGTFSFYVSQTTNGCESQRAQLNVIVTPQPTLDVPTNLAACPGELLPTVNFTSTFSNVTYAWSNDNTTIGLAANGASSLPSFTTLNPTNNDLLATISVTPTVGTCTGSPINFTITIHPLPSINAGNDTSICPNSSFTLSGSGAATYSWNNGVVNGNSFIPSTVISTYTVVGTSAAGCTNSDDITIQFYSVENVSFSPDIVLGCSPLLVNFTNSTLNSVNCNWDFGNGNTSTNCGTTSATFAQVGCYDITLNVTFSNGCTNSLTQPNLVCVEAPPLASFVATPAILNEYDSQATFNNTTIGGVSYIWNFGDSTALSNEISPEHDYAGLPLGNYLVTLIAFSPSGCIDSVTSVIQIKEDLLIYIPNCFTPDQDEFNQFFEPVFTSGFDPFDYNLYIYNRWGQLIFESHDHTQGWDGANGNDGNARLVPDGIYTWKIEFKTSDTDERKVIVGHVNVLR